MPLRSSSELRSALPLLPQFAPDLQEHLVALRLLLRSVLDGPSQQREGGVLCKERDCRAEGVVDSYHIYLCRSANSS
jgi:hypothetical protein